MNSLYKFCGSLKTSLRIVLLGFVITLFHAQCTKLVTVGPPKTNITSANVFSEDATAISAITGIYPRLLMYVSSARLSLIPALAADELSLIGGANSPNSGYIPIYLNAIQPLSPGDANFCNTLYVLVFRCNSALEGINGSSSLTPAVKQQLLGEAKFMRAFSYFYLVNYYGDVPLVTTTDYTVNTNMPRTPKDKVYEQIIADLKDAETLLNEQYVGSDVITPYSAGSEERIRPTKWAAKALLARTYLYTEKWAEAEDEATSLIDHTESFGLETLDRAFLKNNKEAIWQLQPSMSPYAYSNSEDGNLFVIRPDGPYNDSYYLTDFVLNDFEPNDQRFTNWVDSVVSGGQTYHFPFKYKLYKSQEAVNEYTVVFRLGEQYLIRSEARAHQNKLDVAAEDLDAIRTRAGLGNTTATDQTGLLDAVLKERRIELFTEWGHRWFDLKRTGKIDEVMNVVTPLKGGSWSTDWQLFPFSISDLTGNPNLVQNKGYK